MKNEKEKSLKQTLGAFQVWGLAVGLVISGEYFGWSYGWGVSSTFGLLTSTLFMATFFVILVLALSQFSMSLPHKSGIYSFVEAGLGSHLAQLASLCTLVEFLFAPPAISFALGSYLHVIFPSFSQNFLAMLMLVTFGLINLFPLHLSAKLELIITLLAVGELLCFSAVMVPHFSWQHFSTLGWEHGVGGIFASIPFALWFFLGIEGIVLTSEEIKNPARNIPLGTITGIITLVVLAILTMLMAGGAGDWHSLSHMDFPIPKAMELAMGADSPWVKAFAGIGLFGLIASLNGIIIGASRQIFTLAREGLFPSSLAKINRFGVPHLSVILTMVVGVVGLLTGKTGELITMAGFGAIFTYILVLLSYFQWRRKHSLLAIAGICMASLSFVAMTYYNFEIFLIFCFLLVLLHSWLPQVEVVKNSYFERQEQNKLS